MVPPQDATCGCGHGCFLTPTNTQGETPAINPFNEQRPTILGELKIKKGSLLGHTSSQALGRPRAEVPTSWEPIYHDPEPNMMCEYVCVLRA